MSLEEMLRSGETADPAVQYSIGTAYLNGDGVEQDYKQAVYWISKAAEQGDQIAQYDLSVMYLNGEGVEQDYGKGFYWVSKAAAQQGLPEAQFNLAVMYANGNGVEVNLPMALEWHTKAAEQGLVQSQNILGRTYYDGDAAAGVAQDVELAEKWLMEASLQGDAEAQFYLANLYAYRIQPPDMKEAMKWAMLSADQGNSYAQELCGLFLTEGKGIAANPTLALQYIRQSAEQDNEIGIYDLALFYMNGTVVAKDVNRAIELFRSSSAKGFHRASYNLGIIYGQGLGVPLDLHESKKWFQIAAQQGDEEAAEKVREVERLIKQNTNSGGCYVATAVYGSYDCPEVWTLRRFRDYTLARTVCGRAFIQIYYALSPIIVKWFGHTGWFSRMWRGVLDCMVRKLQDKGVENTPYEDKEY